MSSFFQVMDQPDLCGRTALMWAAARGACDMVRAMCRHGADLAHQVSREAVSCCRRDPRRDVCFILKVLLIRAHLANPTRSRGGIH